VAEPGATRLADEYRAVVRGIARAPLAPPPFEAAAYDPSSIAAARAHWRKRMVDEYESTTVFSALAAQLVDAGATLDAPVVALRMAQDEFRHAEICGDVVVALGGNKSTRWTPVVRPLPAHDDCCKEERALRNVIATSISESYSAAFFVASLDRMEDPHLRAVTKSLLADETLHARFAFHYLSAWCAWLTTRPDVRARVSRYIATAFAACERDFVRPDAATALGGDADRLGLVPRAEANALFFATMRDAVAPALDAFGLEASSALKRATVRSPDAVGILRDRDGSSRRAQT